MAAAIGKQRPAFRARGLRRTVLWPGCPGDDLILPMQEAWAASGMQTYPNASRTPEAGDLLFHEEIRRWSTLVRDNSIKAD